MSRGLRGFLVTPMLMLMPIVKVRKYLLQPSVSCPLSKYESIYYVPLSHIRYDMAENCQKLRQKKSPRPKPWGWVLLGDYLSYTCSSVSLIMSCKVFELIFNEARRANRLVLYAPAVFFLISFSRHWLIKSSAWSKVIFLVLTSTGGFGLRGFGFSEG